MAEFDPKEYLRKKTGQGDFDPSAYLQSKGVEPAASKDKETDPSVAKTPVEPSTGQSIIESGKEFGKSFVTGAAKTAAEFARGEQIESEQRASAFGPPSPGPKVPTGAELVEAFSLHQPKGYWGEAGQLGGEFAINPATYFGPGSAVGKFLITAASIFGGAATQQMGAGPIPGMLVGGVVPAGILKAMSPVFVEQGRKAAGQLLNSEGITSISAGEYTGSKSLRYAESIAGDAPFVGGKASAIEREGGRQLTRAILRRIGVNNDFADAKTIDDAYKNIGGRMNAIMARNNWRPTPAVVNKMVKAADEYENVVQPDQQRPIVRKIVDDFLTRLTQSPNISGEQIKSFRTDLLELQRKSFSDAEYSNALGGIVDAIDDGIQASLSKSDFAEWKLAKRQYRNWITVSKAAAGTGEKAAEGIITPAKLRQALTSTMRDKRAYSRGIGDFAALSRAANAVMTPLPNSGTSQREMIRALAQSLTTAVGFAGAAFGFTRNPEIAGAAGIAGAALPTASMTALGRTLMSKPAQSYMAGRIPGQSVARSAYEGLPNKKWNLLRAGVPSIVETLDDGQ